MHLLDLPEEILLEVVSFSKAEDALELVKVYRLRLPCLGQLLENEADSLPVPDVPVPSSFDINEDILDSPRKPYISSTAGSAPVFCQGHAFADFE